MTGLVWQIDEFRGHSGLQRLEADWKQLCAAMPARASYHPYEAHVAYLNHLCRTPDLVRYLTLSDGHRVRAICPLEPGCQKVFGLPIKVWSLPYHPHWQITDVIAPEDEAREALIPCVLEYLHRHPLGRRVLVLGPLPEESVLWKGMPALGPSRCCLCSDSLSSFVDCAVSYEQLMSGLSARFRSNLRAGHRKLEQLGNVRFVKVLRGDELEAEFAAFLDVEASGWKGQDGIGSAIALYPDLTAFYRDLTTTMLAPADHCEIISLYAAGHCIASAFGMRTGEDYAGLKIGYNEMFSRLGPGQILLEKTLERCCSDPGIKRLDLSGDPAWTRVWRPQHRRLRQAYVAIGGAYACRLQVALLNLRFGPVRRVVRSLRRLRK